MSMFAFTPENEAAFTALFKRYPQKKALTLPGLWIIQTQQGYLSEEAMEHLAGRLELPYMHIYSVATFYTMFRFTPPAKVTVEVCRTLSCDLCGKAELVEHLKQKYGIESGEMSPDGQIELLEVECLGACGGAPMCALNGNYHENATPASLDAALKELGC